MKIYHLRIYLILYIYIYIYMMQLYCHCTYIVSFIVNHVCIRIFLLYLQIVPIIGATGFNY